MKKMSVASLNRFSDSLSHFPSFSVLTVSAIKRIFSAFENEAVLKLATACVTLDYKVAFANWEKKVEKGQTAIDEAKKDGADAEALEKMEKDFNKLMLSKPYLNTDNYYLFGYILQNFYGVTASCIVPREAWHSASVLRLKLYSDNDLGKTGKAKEVKKRLSLYELNGQTKTTWSEFSAHKAGKKDIVDKVEKINIESKTGVGDWYTSKRAKTLESMRKELERKERDIIEWDYTKIIRKEATKRKPARLVKIEIKYRKTWKEFFSILEGYNGDVGTWFKPIIETENGYLLQMQEIQTSEKKIAYLMQYNDNF